MIDPTDQPDVRTVYCSSVFYHGTRAAPFRRPNPGTSLTPNWDIARFYSQRGAFQDSAKVDGRPRILTATVDLPEGVVFIPASQACNELISMIHNTKVTSREDEIRRDQEHQKIRAAYHDEAAQHAQRLGYRAYFADMFQGSQQAELVVLDPDVITITNQYEGPDLTPRPLPQTNTYWSRASPPECSTCLTIFCYGDRHTLEFIGTCTDGLVHEVVNSRIPLHPITRPTCVNAFIMSRLERQQEALTGYSDPRDIAKLTRLVGEAYSKLAEIEETMLPPKDDSTN